MAVASLVYCDLMQVDRPLRSCVQDGGSPPPESAQAPARQWTGFARRSTAQGNGAARPRTQAVPSISHASTLIHCDGCASRTLWVGVYSRTPWRATPGSVPPPARRYRAGFPSSAWQRRRIEDPLCTRSTGAQFTFHLVRSLSLWRPARLRPRDCVRTSAHGTGRVVGR